MPFSHLQDARHLNLAACGAPFSASRAASNAPTLTPLLTLVSAIATLLDDVWLCFDRWSEFRIIHRHRATLAMTGNAGRTSTLCAEAKDMIALMTTPASKAAAGSVGTVETQFLDLPDPIPLDCGRSLSPVRVAYETYGTLSPARDNVILVCHALSGDAHAAGFAKTPPPESTRDGFRADERDAGKGRGLGWWDGMIGPGKAFDTDRFFVVSSNLLGGCRGTTGPSSIDPATGRAVRIGFSGHHRRRHGARRTRAAARARHHASRRDRRRIARRHAGARVGGQYGDEVGAIIPIASTHALHPQGVAWNAIARSAITSDPAWQGGHYYGTGRAPTAGMGVARMVGHITYLSSVSLERKFGRRLQFADDIRYTLTEPEFEIENYLRYQADSFVKRFDANTYLYTSRALSYFDLARQYGGGQLARRDSTMSARTLLIAFSSDWLYPPAGFGAARDGVARARQGRRAARHRRAVRARLFSVGRSAPDSDDPGVPRGLNAADLDL